MSISWVKGLYSPAEIGLAPFYAKQQRLGLVLVHPVLRGDTVLCTGSPGKPDHGRPLPGKASNFVMLGIDLGGEKV